MNLRHKLVAAMLLALTLTLTSCGGGTYTAGAGGSGIGGTGITTVTGNVSQVVAEARQPESPFAADRMLALLARVAAGTANAESGRLAGIVVIGGGQQTTTDGAGNFTLVGVIPGDNFVLTFSLPNEESVTLPIGTVPSDSQVQVNNVVLRTGRGTAAAESIVVKPNGPANSNGQGNGGVSNGAPGQGTGHGQNNPGAGNPQAPGNSGNNGNGNNGNNGKGQGARGPT